MRNIESFYVVDSFHCRDDFLTSDDQNTNRIRVEIGPNTLVLHSNEQMIGPIQAFVLIPPRHYCRIANPVLKEKSEFDNFQLQQGHYEYRFFGEPFPLFPGEEVVGRIEQLPSVLAEHAIHLRSESDIEFDG